MVWISLLLRPGLFVAVLVEDELELVVQVEQTST